MRALAVVGLGLAVGCATTPKDDVEMHTSLHTEPEPSVSTDATSTGVEATAPVSSFATSSEATTEPETSSSSVVVETSSAETSAAPSTSASSSEPATSTVEATSETSVDASSAVTSEEPGPELTMANVVDVLTALGADSEPLTAFRVRIVPRGGLFYGASLEGDDALIPRFDPPLVEWVSGCGYAKAIVRVPPGMCAMVSGDLKQTAQVDPSPTCETDLIVPTCANAEHRSSRTQPSGEPTHTEIETITAYAYTDEECAPESAPAWSALVYDGACPQPN